MYGYISWPGVYSFKEEIGMFMEYLREQIDEVMKKIEETEDLVADKAAKVQLMIKDIVKPVKIFYRLFVISYQKPMNYPYSQF